MRPQIAYADSGGSCGDGVTWYFTSATGNLTISGNGNMADYAVGSEPWYLLRSSITSLTINSGVRRIGGYAFYYCTALTGALTLPEGLESIGDGAFYSCQGLTGDVTIPASVTSISNGAFLGIGSTAINVDSNNANYASVYGILYNKALTELIRCPMGKIAAFTDLNIPLSVTSIGDRAFFSCSGLTGELIIPGNVESIGDYAFAGCSGFTGELTIPASVTSISSVAFIDIGLTAINVDSNNANYASVDGILYNKALTELIQCPTGKTAVFTSLNIPSSVTSIDSYAFMNCSGLTGDLTIPVDVESIGNNAFYGCSGLTGDLTIPEGVTSIGNNAFYGCSGLTGDLTIPTGVESIGNYAFYGCSGLMGDLTIPTGVESIGNYAFYGCSGLTGDLTIPEGVMSIGGNAFQGCSELESATVPDSVTTVGYSAFAGTSSAFVIYCHYGSAANSRAKSDSIKYNNLYDAEISGVIDGEYTGSAVTQSSLVVTAKTLANPEGVTITKDVDYTVTYLDNVDAGTATATIAGKTNYAGTLDRDFTISAATFTVENIAAQKYAGLEITPEVVAKNGDVTLIKDTDYTVAYSNNTGAGTGTATVMGINNYTGTVNVQFHILGDAKVILNPDATSKNAGYDGYIDVSFEDATGYDAYALAIPMLFDNDTIEITNLETVDFDTKGLTGLLVNGTFLSGARDYDSSSEVLSVINSEGKFLLSWTVEEDIPLTPHTLTDDVYFKIHYKVKENVPTSASFAIGEYNIDNGIDQDQIFGVDGLGILSSNQDDFGAYLLVDGEHGILTQDYINVTVEDMPPVTISGDVNSISLQGRAMLTGKQRTPISAVSYTPNLSKIDAGIRVEMYEVDAVGDVVKQVGSVAYTQEMNMTAAIGDPTSTLYNYTLNIPRTVANDLKISDPTGSSPKYMLRFSRFGDNGGSVVGTVREESYLWADIYLDGTAVNTGTIDESTPLTVGGTAYLYAGAFYLPTAEKFAITASDLNTIKGQVGNADITGVTTIYNINEYLGVDAADYTTVLRYVGKTKLQAISLAVNN